MEGPETLFGLNTDMAELYIGNIKIEGAEDSSDVLIPIPYGNTPEEYITDQLVSSTNLEGVTELADNGFARTGITTIHIPASVTKIGSYCFLGCSNLRHVYFEGNPPTLYQGNENSTFMDTASGITFHYKADNSAWISYEKSSDYGGATDVVWESY